jgi:hypothetical protein
VVVFSDESRFCLGMHDGRQRVRRLRGERRNSAYSVERHVARTVGVMIWRAICYGSKSPLIFIQGSMNARRYVQEVLECISTRGTQAWLPRCARCRGRATQNRVHWRSPVLFLFLLSQHGKYQIFRTGIRNQVV